MDELVADLIEFSQFMTDEAYRGLMDELREAYFNPHHLLPFRSLEFATESDEYYVVVDDRSVYLTHALAGARDPISDVCYSF